MSKKNPHIQLLQTHTLRENISAKKLQQISDIRERHVHALAGLIATDLRCGLDKLELAEQDLEGGGRRFFFRAIESTEVGGIEPSVEQTIALAQFVGRFRMRPSEACVLVHVRPEGVSVGVARRYE